MAAIVTFKSGHSYEFHVGCRRVGRWGRVDIVSLYCDGHELDQAEDIIGRKVPTTCRSFVFVGDEAKTIFLNFR